MFYLYQLSGCSKQPLSLLSLITKSKPIPLNYLCFTHGERSKINQSCSLCYSSSCVVHAVEKDSQQYEIDQEKAREALQKLDQQLQQLSKKQVTPPKVKASDVKITRDQTTEEVPEMSGSILALIAAGLFLFTIFYNILYITVIDQPIQQPEETQATPTENN